MDGINELENVKIEVIDGFSFKILCDAAEFGEYAG